MYIYTKYYFNDVKSNVLKRERIRKIEKKYVNLKLYNKDLVQFIQQYEDFIEKNLLDIQQEQHFFDYKSMH